MKRAQGLFYWFQFPHPAVWKGTVNIQRGSIRISVNMLDTMKNLLAV